MSINVISINKILFWAIFSIKNSNHIYFFCFRFCQFSQHGWLMWRYRSVRTVVWVYVKQKCQLSCGCSISQLLFKWGINVFVLPCENEDVGGKYTEIQSLLWEKIRYWIWIPKTEPWRSLEVFSLLSSPRWSDPEFYLNRITCVSCWWCCKNIELQS